MTVAAEMPKGSRIVTILPDSIRNYLTKFVDDRWMRENGFMEPDWAMGSVAEMLRAMAPREVVTAEISDNLGDVVKTFRERGFSQLPVTDQGRLAGILTESDLLHVMMEGHATASSKVAEVMARRVSTVPLHASTSELPDIFERGEVALVVDDDQRVQGLLTKLDLIDYLTKTPQV